MAWIRVAATAALPVGAAAAWTPLRDQLPNTDLALLLVLLIGAVGWYTGSFVSEAVVKTRVEEAAAVHHSSKRNEIARRRGVNGRRLLSKLHFHDRVSALSALGGALGFDLMDTRPYGALTIDRGADVTTAVVLLCTGLAVGAGASRLARYRRTEGRRDDALDLVVATSGLMATGQEHRLVAEAVTAELVRRLELLNCRYVAAAPNGARPCVARDGGLVGLVGTGPAPVVDLPVWSHGEILGHFQMSMGRRRPNRDELRVALSLADQAGAAIGGDDGGEPPSPPSRRRLHVVPPA